MALLRAFLELIFLRKGPEDMPAGRDPTLIALGFYLAVGLLLDRAAPVELPDGSELSAGLGFGMVLVDALVVALFSAMLVSIVDKKQRLPQMLTALYGSLAMLGLVAWPLIVNNPDPMATGDDGLGVLEIMLFGLLIWNLVVLGQIYRRTLDSNAVIGVLAALGYFIMSSLVYVSVLSWVAE